MKIRSLSPLAALGLSVLIFLPACLTNSATTTASTAATPTTGTTVATTTTSATTATTAPNGPSGCGNGVSAIDDGVVVDTAELGSDAEQISTIGWETTETCEVFTIEFTTDQGAPATTPPPVHAEFLREVGILRVSMGVEMTSVTDLLAETPLVRQIFVPRSADRTLFVDLHLSGAALASVETTSSPARVVISLEPGGTEYPASPAIAANVVLISPVEGPVESPVVVNGYSRNFEANTIARITQGSDILAEGFTTAADWSETWGEFTITLEPTGTGPSDLFVGEQSAQDGSDRGAVIPIDLG